MHCTDQPPAGAVDVDHATRLEATAHVKDRKRILFVTHPEPGHILPTFKLARILSTRGHDVRYAAVPDMEKFIEAHGFTIVPWCAHFYPKGYRHAEDGHNFLLKRRSITKRYADVARHLLTDRDMPSGLSDWKPDLMAVDLTETVAALFAIQRGFELVLLNTSLPQTRDRGVPPLRQAQKYGEGLYGRLRATYSWESFLAFRRLSGWAAACVGMSPPYELARRWAIRLGFSRQDLDSNTVYMPQVRRVHEVVFCPEQLDFPRPPMKYRHYAPSIYLQRKETEFPWLWLQPVKPLIYCAFGTQRYRTRDVVKFLRRLLVTIRCREDLQWIVSLGPNVQEQDVGVAADNAIIVRDAPQLAILSKARVMITHGGLGSVKECIFFGVPMLVFPLEIDQPGNAARIAHHGLGLVGDIRRTTAQEISTMLDRVIGDAGIQSRMDRMRERLHELENSVLAADLMEKVTSVTAALERSG